MTETQLISKLSELPTEVVNDIRMMAAILRNQEQSKRFDTWIKRCNQALEQKQENYWTCYEDLSENNTLGI